MGKASFDPATFTESGGFSFGEGWGEISEISSIVHQFKPNKKTGEQYDAATNVKMMLVHQDADGKSTGQDPVEELVGCGKLEKFHPGVVDNAQDEDAEDQGDALGAEGNCIFSVTGGGFDKKSKWAIFLNSLVECGFKREVIANGYLPDLIGTRGFFTQMDVKQDDGKTYKALVMNKITRFPYDKGAAGSSKKGTQGAAAATSTSKGTASAPATAPSSNGTAAAAGGDDAIAEASARMMALLKAKNAGSTLPFAKIGGKLITLLAKSDLKAAQHKQVQEQFQNLEWLEQQAEMQGIGFDGDDKALIFPAA